MRKVWFILISAILLLQSVGICSGDELIFSEAETEQHLNLLRELEIFSLYRDEKIFFNDSEPVTRAEVAQAVCGLLDCVGIGDGERVSGAFLDVPAFHSAAKEIDTVVSLGIMLGMNNGMFEPNSEISLNAFAKVMVTALGWQWKAELSGGYPRGYFSVAQQMGLLDGINEIGDTPLCRAQLVKILYLSLEVPVYDIHAITSGKLHFSADKEENVLSIYHDIYSEKAIVYSDAITSLKTSYKPKEGYILIGENEVLMNGRTEIWEYFGQQVNYYYRENKDEMQLLWFTATKRNEIHVVLEKNFESYQNGTVSYVGENGKSISVNISDAAAVIYNGGKTEKNIASLLNLKAGRMKLISNDGDSDADVVLIEEFSYDCVDFIDNALEIIYGEEKLDTSAYQYFLLTDEYGKGMELEKLYPNDILEIVRNESASLMKIRVIRNAKSVRADEVDAAGEILITSDGETLWISRLCNMKAEELNFGNNYTLHINQYNEVVWVEEKTQTSKKLGYLIKAAEKKKGLNVEVDCTILLTNGAVENFTVGEKLRIDGKTYEREEVCAVLAAAKQKLNLASDGAVSQLIQYSSEENELKEINTASKETANDNIILKCNSGGKELSYRNTGYSTGIFDNKYAISSETVIFKVPSKNQESANKDYFSTREYTNQLFTDGGNFCIETYVCDRKAIVPTVAVWYSLSESEDISETANLLLVEDIRVALDKEGNPVKRISGYYTKKKVMYDVIDEVKTDGVAKGDIIVISLNAGDRIQSLKKVYDYESETVLSEFVGTSVRDRRAVRRMKVYNAPENSDFIELISTDFFGEEPEPEDIVLVSMKAVRNGSNTGIATCIDGRKFSNGESQHIVDYKHDAGACTEAVVRFSSGYTGDVIFYEK